MGVQFILIIEYPWLKINADDTILSYRSANSQPVNPDQALLVRYHQEIVMITG
jgi:hypothetical protein